MTPKEKAIEMYKKYLDWISNTYYHVGTYSKSEGEKSKECVLIAVNEIINSSPSAPVLSDAGSFVNDIQESTEWWKDVKKEVEKITA